MAASVDARMVAWVDGESINAGGLRLGQAASSMGGATALASRGGVRPSGGEPGLIAALPTPAMKVRVTPGIFVIPSASPTGGEYRIALETQTDLDVDNSGSFPRTDLVIVEVVDTGTSLATATVRVLKGATDSPGAARPTNTTPNAHYIVLGSVDIRVGAESGGNIRAQDVHPERAWAVAAGGILPVATKTEMDAVIGSEGVRAVVTSGADQGQEWEWRSGGWKWPKAAQGRLAYDTRTTDAGPITTAAVVADVTVTVTIPAGQARKVRVTTVGQAYGTSAGSTAELKILRDGAAVRTSTVQFPIASNGVGYAVQRDLDLAAGTYVFTLQAARGAGAGDVFLDCAADNPLEMYADDLGAA